VFVSLLRVAHLSASFHTRCLPSTTINIQAHFLLVPRPMRCCSSPDSPLRPHLLTYTPTTKQSTGQPASRLTKRERDEASRRPGPLLFFFIRQVFIKASAPGPKSESVPHSPGSQGLAWSSETVFFFFFCLLCLPACSVCLLGRQNRVSHIPGHRESEQTKTSPSPSA